LLCNNILIIKADHQLKGSRHLDDIILMARRVLEIEAAELRALVDRLTPDFSGAVTSILQCRGRVIVSGMGKSGLIGKKIAATLASTGTPSFFLHPGEANHGDLGMVAKDDILLLISRSGETDELLRIIPFLKSQGNEILAFTGNPRSTLAKNARYHIDVTVSQEACPMALVPTASTTATLAMGDALAITLMRLRNFQEKDFAQFHPGGSLGRRLLTQVSDVMRATDLPICTPDEGIQDIVYVVSQGKLGLCVVSENGRIRGIITDGDIRRAMKRFGRKFLDLKASDFMTTQPIAIPGGTKLTEAYDVMNRHKVNSLLVTEEDRLIGVVQIYDLNV
jgi:arabinose-5-phosphate isomerase